jgi:hypothetical protein
MDMSKLLISKNASLDIKSISAGPKLQIIVLKLLKGAENIAYKIF